MTNAPTPSRTDQVIAATERWAAHNYHPLPVVLATGDGAWVTDVEGRRFLDCLAGYSAVNFGHGNPRLLRVAHEQFDRLTLTSRAFYNDQLGDFAQALTALTGKDMCLPMNSGAEAVETALKVARKWGYRTRGIPEGAATIIVMEGNFHGRTTTIVSFSDDKVAHDEYGPYTPGFVTVPYGDADALAAALQTNEFTVAVLVEPIQGEGGVVIPPEGYLRRVRKLCSGANALMMADEIQSGLARTGETFACDHEGVVPDVYILGKALGGGIMPLSAIACDHEIMDVITPGSHGSTFGGNPFACAIGTEVCAMLETGEFQAAARERGAQLAAGLEPLLGAGLTAYRQRGLWAGLDLDPTVGTGRELCERLVAHGILAKDTHGSTIRLAPPLVATSEDIELLLGAVSAGLADMTGSGVSV
ncbi:putative Ornithine aminotransferase (rocD; EC number [Nostocoides australiense Ben110]|uniref:ornithine aminotransferase n=1 Tax=Nostocoides australiense Ben110 TaxID=1193182 RepID=W6K3F6_9MICO|nr:ornithine--oxo-acid transaminase [Tetrasphaera australiensis]CCH73179.1 putative Ornithine aminotransferase (rocD; EC number [Tetrasphaera australiensis Ben110]